MKIPDITGWHGLRLCQPIAMCLIVGRQQDVNRLSGLMAVSIGLILCTFVIPAQTESVNYGATAPALFPMLGAGVMVAAGLWHWALPRGEVYFRLPYFMASVGLALLAAAGFGLILIFGYVVVAPAFILALMLTKGERRPIWLCFGGIAIPLFIWFLFVHVLERPLP